MMTFEDFQRTKHSSHLQVTQQQFALILEMGPLPLTCESQEAAGQSWPPEGSLKMRPPEAQASRSQAVRHWASGLVNGLLLTLTVRFLIL